MPTRRRRSAAAAAAPPRAVAAPTPGEADDGGRAEIAEASRRSRLEARASDVTAADGSPDSRRPASPADAARPGRGRRADVLGRVGETAGDSAGRGGGGGRGGGRDGDGTGDGDAGDAEGAGDEPRPGDSEDGNEAAGSASTGEDEDEDEVPAGEVPLDEDESVPAEDLERALAAAAEGDEDAWRWIVDRYARRVFGLIHAQCGEPETAEEITQSAFCTVVAKIGEYTEQGRFEAWLFRIAMNRLRDEMRRRRRHAVPVEQEALAGLAGGEPDEGAGLGTADEIGALRVAMARLPEADRRVLHLRHAAGMSFKGMAEYLGQPLGTVLARHHRALRKLREDLAPRLDPDHQDESGPVGGPGG